MKFIIIKSNFDYWNDCLNDIQQMLYPIHQESDRIFVLTVNLNRYNAMALLDSGRIDPEFPWISWIQDHPNPACKTMKPWVEHTNDYMFGYTHGMKCLAGSDERLYETPFFVNPNRFKQVKEGLVKKICDVVFITNKGADPYKMMDKHYHKLVDKLMKHYYEDNGGIIKSETQLSNFFHGNQLWQEGIDSLEKFRFRFFWVVNESIYRQSIVQKYLDQGIDIKVFGHGWIDNPRFKHIAGNMIRGVDIHLVYRMGEYALHVDCAGGKHQRPIEILLSGGKCLAPEIGSINPAKFNRHFFCDLQQKQLFSVFRAIMYDEPANYRHYQTLQDFEPYCYKEPV